MDDAHDDCTLGRKNMKLKDAKNKYLNTRQFAALSRSSQRNYEYALASFCRMSIMGKTLGNVRVDRINSPMCHEIYDTWEAETSTSNANHNASVLCSHELLSCY